MRLSKIFRNIGLYSMIVILLLIVVMVAIPQLFGMKAYKILEESMEPKYSKGSLIYVKSISPRELHIGDDITFIKDNSLTVVTHRIVDISKDKQYFTTKGIADKLNDEGPVYCMNIIGVPKIAIPYLGYIMNYFETNYGRVFGIGIIVLLVSFALFPVKSGKKSKSKHKTKIIKGNFASEV